ncbi:MAG: VWA domain-containing protein [Bacteroidota bacterium]
MTFAYPWLLLLLLAVPVLAWLGRRRATAGLLFSETAAAEGVPPTLWARLAWLPGALLLGALALSIVALARPQERDVTREQYAEGIDIVLVLDVSTSMKADDFYPNRFQAAKAVAAEFIDGRLSDRIGLVVFAAQAYTQAPLTLDYGFLKQMLGEVRMGVIEDGTAIGTAIATGTARLRDADTPSKVMVLLTDGQNNRGEIDPGTAAEVAEALGVKIYAIGVGSETGGVVRQQTPFGGTRRVPALQVDEETLRAVAEKTGGRYFRARDAEALRQIYAEISELERTEIQERVYVDVDERYALFLRPALFLLLLSVVLGTTRLLRVP